MDTRKAGEETNHVVVVDENRDTRSHLKGILQSTDDFKLAGEFSDTDKALIKLPSLRPHVVLLGIPLPNINGIKLIQRFKQILAGLKIVIIMASPSPDFLELSLQAGVDECLIKPVNAEQCVVMLQCACFRQIPSGLESPHFSLDSKQPMTGKSHPLSSRENEVMRCFAEGLLYKEIPDRLGLSYSAVRKYQQKIYRKFHVTNRSEAIRVWLGNNVNESGDSRSPFFPGRV